MLYEVNEDEVKGVCGIDTLYFHLKTEQTNYITKYDYLEHLVIDCEAFEYEGMRYTGKSGGFHWFILRDENVKIGNIGFKSPYKQLHIKNIYVQLDGEALYYYGAFNAVDVVRNSLKKMGFTVETTHVSRVDLNIFTNVSFSQLDVHYTAMPSRSERDYSTFRNGFNEIETIYFGKRQNGKVLRIYNKMLELAKNEKDLKNTLLMNMLIKKGVITDYHSALWNIELELHRKFLKKHYNIDTLDDLKLYINAIFRDEMARYKLLTKDEKYASYLKNDKNKIPELPVWLKIKENYEVTDMTQNIEKNKTPKYIMSKQALMKRTFELLAKYNHYNQDAPLSLEEYIYSIVELTLDPEAIKELHDDDTEKYVDIEIYDKDGFLRKIARHLKMDRPEADINDYSSYFEPLETK